MAIPNLDQVFKKYGDWWCKKNGGKCDRMNVVQKKYEKYRLIISDMHIEYYDDPDNQIEPKRGVEQTLKNETSVEQTQTAELSETTTESFKWSLTEGFKIGMSVKFGVGVPPIASGETTISTELSFSSTQEKTKTDQKTWKISQPVKVPSRTETKAVLLIDQRKFSQPFHSKCVLSGYVCSNSPDRVVNKDNPKQGAHYFWFHPISSILTKFPQPGFTVKGDKVYYEGDGKFEGIHGIRTRLALTERPIDDKDKVLNSYNIVEPMQEAGFAVAT